MVNDVVLMIKKLLFLILRSFGHEKFSISRDLVAPLEVKRAYSSTIFICTLYSCIEYYLDRQMSDDSPNVFGRAGCCEWQIL